MNLSVVDIITLETGLGIFVAGVIVGWFLSIVTAYVFVRHYKRFMHNIEQDSHWRHD